MNFGKVWELVTVNNWSLLGGKSGNVALEKNSLLYALTLIEVCWLSISVGDAC